MDDSTPITSNREYTKPGDVTVNRVPFWQERINTGFDDIDTDVEAIDVRLIAAEADIATAQSDITAIQAEDDTLQDNIDVNSAGIATLRTEMDNTYSVANASNFSAVSGKVHLVDTSAGAVTATLTASPVVTQKSYTFIPVTNWNSYGFSVNPGTGIKIEGSTGTRTFTGVQALRFTYVSTAYGYSIQYIATNAFDSGSYLGAGRTLLIPSSNPAPFLAIPRSLPVQDGGVNGSTVLTDYSSTGNFNLGAGYFNYRNFTMNSTHQWTLSAGITYLHCTGTVTIGAGGIIGTTGTATTVADGFARNAGSQASNGSAGPGAGTYYSDSTVHNGGAGSAGSNASGVSILGGSGGSGGGGGAGNGFSNDPTGGAGDVGTSGRGAGGGGGAGSNPYDGSTWPAGSGGAGSPSGGGGNGGTGRPGSGGAGPINGGAGGSAGSNGSNGADSENTLIIVADAIVFTNSGNISITGSNATAGTNGGNGSAGSVQNNGSSGGGGGGGGGKGGAGADADVLIIIVRQITPATMTMSIAGGAGGNGGNGGNGGAGGGGGSASVASGGGGGGAGGAGGAGGDPGLLWIEYQTGSLTGITRTYLSTAGTRGTAGSAGAGGTGSARNGGAGGAGAQAGTSTSGATYALVQNKNEIVRGVFVG